MPFDPFSTPHDASRSLRDRLAAGARARRRQSTVSVAGGTPRFLGQVTNRGSIPSSQGRIYLVNPAEIEGNETEGGSATFSVDSSRAIPVVVIGGRTLVVGDFIVAQSIGGRWIADSGLQLNYCNPSVGACVSSLGGNVNNARYSVNGTVTDSINGTQPITYDYTNNAWYSAWLPFTSPRVLQSGVGSNPCTVASGTSYYFHKLAVNSTTGLPVATLALPGQTCQNGTGGPTIAAFFKYENTQSYAPYPAILGAPASWASNGFPVSATSTPSSCDPFVFNATWPTTGTAGSSLPMSGATYQIPKSPLRSWGYSCGTPCPLPRKDLHVSWTMASSNANGSGTLVYDPSAKSWSMPCSGNISLQLTVSGTQAIGFAARLYSSSGCSGTSTLFSLGTSLSLASFTCEPLDIEFKPTFTTQALYLAGYRLFIITE